MTTFMPFVDNCYSLKQHQIALLTEHNFSIHHGPINSLYPKKLKNFRQCPVFAAVFHTPPLVIIKSQKIGNSTLTAYDGIDTQILEQLAKKLNFNLIYRMPSDKENRGTIYPNGTLTGCIKMVP